MKRVIIGFIVAAGLSAASASAATYSVSFTQDGRIRNAASHDFVEGDSGITVGVTASHYKINATTGAYRATRRAAEVDANLFGLTSNNCHKHGTIDCGSFQKAIDSKGREGDEAMVFNFDTAVRLVGVSLSIARGYGFDLVVDGALDDTIRFNTATRGAAISSKAKRHAKDFSFDPTEFGTTFALGTRTMPVGNGKKVQSRMKILGLIFETEDGTVLSSGSLEQGGEETDQKIGVVPLPAAGVLLMGGLAGLGWAGRRRNKVG
jgi:hypothetical protein